MGGEGWRKARECVQLAFCEVMSYASCDCRPLRTDLTETVERSEAWRIASMIGVNCARAGSPVSFVLTDERVGA